MKQTIVPLLLAALVFGAGCSEEEKPSETPADTAAATSTPLGDTSASTAGSTAAGTDSGSTAAPAGENKPAGAGSGPAKVDEKKYKTTATGLKYAVLKPGNGAEAKNGQTVAVHYTGWLKDGTKFDSSRDRGEPIRFPLGTGGVIPGWDEGIKGMKVGEQRQLVIPPKLGYGEGGSPPVIPPNATLVFDVELVETQ